MESELLRKQGIVRVLGRATIAIVVVITVLSSMPQAYSQPSLKVQRILEGRLELLIPADFSLMSPRQLQRKYPTHRRPNMVYTNSAETVNVTINHSTNTLRPNQIPDIHRDMESLFNELHPQATWFASEVKEINGHRFFLLELRTPAVNMEIRNLIVGTSLEDRFLLISFNAIQGLEDQWMQVGRSIVDSIRLMPAAS